MFSIMLAGFVFSGLVFSPPVAAQVFTNPTIQPIITPNRIWSDFRIAQIGNQMAAEMARGKTSKNSAANKNKSAASKSAASSAIYQKQFAFERAGNSPLAQKMTEAQKGNADDLAKTQQMVDYLWKNYEITFADENCRLGMPFNDVATAMTYYIVASYLYANDIPTLESEYSVAVYKQVSEILSKDAAFSKLQPADRRLFAELLVTMGGMPVVVADKSRNKNDQIKAGQVNLERIFGSQAKALRITTNGIEF